jgi:hypothetical protein
LASFVLEFKEAAFADTFVVAVADSPRFHCLLVHILIHPTIAIVIAEASANVEGAITLHLQFPVLHLRSYSCLMSLQQSSHHS